MPQDAVTEVDAKSILGLMMLGAAKGHRIEMICQDQPCCEPLDALEALIASCFGENE